jgi:hypothetical protein
VTDEVIWSNPLYRDDLAQHGFGVSIGHLTKLTAWRTPTTQLGVIMSGDNYEISITVSYQSIALRDLAEKTKKATATSPF